jgi:hypothetical protein
VLLESILANSSCTTCPTSDSDYCWPHQATGAASLAPDLTVVARTPEDIEADPACN